MLPFFPNGTCVWFQFRNTLAQASELWHWVGSDMQKHIAAWELLAQFALTFCIESRLPRGRGPIACQQGTDNSAADAASAKGLSMAPAVSTVLAPYFTFMRRFHIFPKMTHVPGHLNIAADSLSRFKQPLPEPLTVDDFCDVRWEELLAKVARSVWHWHQKCAAAVRRLWVPSIDLSFGELWAPAGRFSISFWCLFNSPPDSTSLLPRHTGYVYPPC